MTAGELNDADEVRPIDHAFAILATPLECGEPLTNEMWAAGLRVAHAYWPKGGTPRELPEKWR